MKVPNLASAAALLIVWATAGVHTADASFTGLVGTQGSYCLVSAEHTLDPEPCVVEQFAPWECSVSTVPTCTTPNPYMEATTVEGWSAWIADTSSRYIDATSLYAFGDDIAIYISLYFKATRVSPTLLTITGLYQFSSCASYNGCEHVEIALIRYAGDPAAFEALAPETVHDLVAAGLIADSDVLFVQTEFPDAPFPQTTLIGVDVPVNGIPDEQIYLFSTVQTPIPEPSGSIALAFGALTLCGLERRRASRLSRGRAH